MSPRRHYRHSFAASALVMLSAIVMTCIVVPLQAAAGPVTGGSNTSPYLEAAIYQGVISIIPGNTGDSILEIGAVGKDIASSGDIYFRPQSLADVNAALRFSKNGTSGKTDLHVRGRLCLNGSCKDTWPVPGGTSYWAQSGTWLQPITAGRGVVTNTIGGPYPATSLEVYGDHTDGTLFAQHTGGGTALDIGGYTQIHGDLRTTGQITVLDCLRQPSNGYDCSTLATYVPSIVWHPGNDGMGSGLDAGRFEGADWRVCSPNTCSFNDNRWKLCGEIGNFGSLKCFNLP